MRDARRRMDPRRFATLETIPEKFERIQADVATWPPPSTTKYHITVAIDEGSRFRMARLLTTGPGSPVNWEMMKKSLEQGWLSIFGYPQIVRVDPAGPWISEAADNYAMEKHLEAVPIAARRPTTRLASWKAPSSP